MEGYRKCVNCTTSGNVTHSNDGLWCFSNNAFQNGESSKCENTNSFHHQLLLIDTFKYYCECKYEVEHKRPCIHVIAAIKTALVVTKREFYDVWNVRWLGSVWHAKTTEKHDKNYAKRAVLKGAVMYQTGLFLADLPNNPGRKRKSVWAVSDSPAKM